MEFIINTQIGIKKMAFHNYQSLIVSHKRSFYLQVKGSDFVDPDTSRMVTGTYGNPIECSAVFETITEKDFKNYPDFNLTTSDIKLITTPKLINYLTINIKDKISYNGVVYWVYRIINHVFYGNYYIIFLKKEELK